MENNRNKKTGLIVTIALLAVLMIGGTVLYDTLLDAAQPAAVVSAATEAPATEAPATEAAPEVSVTVAPQTESVQATEKPAEVAGPKPRANLAKDFTAYTDDGQSVRLIEKRGKPVVVNFFASWCGPCKMEMPHFDEAAKAYAGQIEFMMVNLCAYGNDTKENAKKMIADGGWTFPVYFDTDGSATLAYNVRSMPTTIFVSADGELIGQQIGAMTAAQLQAQIDKLMK